eukprot:3075534-Prymnesium_polylepis.1
MAADGEQRALRTGHLLQRASAGRRRSGAAEEDGAVEGVPTGGECGGVYAAGGGGAAGAEAAGG